MFEGVTDDIYFSTHLPQLLLLPPFLPPFLPPIFPPSGWCTYYTCLKRLSTFFTLVAEGTDYCIWMTGSLPSGLRFHLLNAEEDDAIRLCIWYKDTQRKDIYKVCVSRTVIINKTYI